MIHELGLYLGLQARCAESTPVLFGVRRAVGTQHIGGIDAKSTTRFLEQPVDRVADHVQLGQVAIYCRVSTDDQSCEYQERDLRAFARRAGHHIVSMFKETVSGARNDRARAGR